MPKVQDQVLARTAWQRMLQIHRRLRESRYPNCSRLAQEMETCTRTIKRDIDFMRFRLNLPVEYDSRKYGYYYSEPVEEFPSVAVTEAEVFALLVAHKAIAQYQGTPFQKPLEAAFRKLTGNLDSQQSFTLAHLDEALSFRPFAPDDTDLETFQVLARAVQEHRTVKFQYKKLGAERAGHRHVRPYHLACIDNHWYLFAFDLDRQALRTFVLTRLRRPKLTAKTFVPPRDFKPDEYLRGSFGVFKGTEDIAVTMEFDAWATDLVRGRKWHATQEFVELPGGQSRLQMRLSSLEELERWVLGWGAHVTVIQPASFGERLRETALAIAGKYRPG